MPYEIAQSAKKRELLPALAKAAKCTCPNCGQGGLFRAYLKVTDECASCGEVFSHHRADDLPPYIAIFIVGHLLVGLMLHFEMAWSIAPWVYLSILLPLAIVMPLALLPSIKGCVVGLQWAMRMHGFDPNHREVAGQ